MTRPRRNISSLDQISSARFPLPARTALFSSNVPITGSILAAVGSPTRQAASAQRKSLPPAGGGHAGAGRSKFGHRLDRGFDHAGQRPLPARMRVFSPV